MERLINLDPVVDLFKQELKEELVGIYLHGSMAMKCFNPLESDVDLLIITRSNKTMETYKRIARRLVLIEEEELKLVKGFELTVVLEQYMNDFVYPTPFEFHYSAVHKEKYKMDADYFCGGFEDTDLAAHLVVTYNRGVALYGMPFHQIYKPIDKKYYINSITSDVKSALAEIEDNPVYYVLNLCRVLQYLYESTVASKKEGGEWAIGALPSQYIQVVDQCLAKYNGTRNTLELNNPILVQFSEYMLQEIEKYINGEVNSEFAFIDFPRIETERFTLRKEEEKDRHDIFELYSNESVVKYMPFTPFTSVQDAINEMNWYQKIFKKQTGLRWMIEDNKSKKVIGTCGFLNYEKIHHRVEIGYDLTPEFWGKGIMTEVAKCIIEFGYLTMKINRIEAKVEPENEASIRLLHKLGFHKEGVLRQHEFEKGKYVDLAIFSRLKNSIKNT